MVVSSNDSSLIALTGKYYSMLPFSLQNSGFVSFWHLLCYILRIHFKQMTSIYLECILCRKFSPVWILALFVTWGLTHGMMELAGLYFAGWWCKTINGNDGDQLHLLSLIWPTDRTLHFSGKM